MSRESYELRGIKGIGEGELEEARREVRGWLGGPRSAAAVEQLIRAVIADMAKPVTPPRARKRKKMK